MESSFQRVCVNVALERDIKMNAVIDSSSRYSHISQNLINYINEKHSGRPTEIEVHRACEKDYKTDKKIIMRGEFAVCRYQIGDNVFGQPMLVMNAYGRRGNELLLGMDWLVIYGVILNFKHGKIEISRFAREDNCNTFCLENVASVNKNYEPNMSIDEDLSEEPSMPQCFSPRRKPIKQPEKKP